MARLALLREGRVLSVERETGFLRVLEALRVERAKLPVAPGVLGVSLRSGHGRVYAADPRKLVAEWQERWPFPGLTWHGHTWAEPDMEDVFKAYSQGYHEILAEAAP